MAWTSLSFSVGQVLTAAQMNNLQANFAALAAGDSGAPSIAVVGGITFSNLQNDNEIGSYSYLRHITANTAITTGTTYNSTDLRYIECRVRTTDGVILGNNGSGTQPPGSTWMALSSSAAIASMYSGALFVRLT